MERLQAAPVARSHEHIGTRSIAGSGGQTRCAASLSMITLTHQTHDTMEQREGLPGSERCVGGRSAAGRVSQPAARLHDQHPTITPYRSQAFRLQTRPVAQQRGGGGGQEAQGGTPGLPAH